MYLCTCEPVYFCAFIRNLQINTEDSGDGDNQGVDGLDDKPNEPDQEEKEDKKKKKSRSKRSSSSSSRRSRRRRRRSSRSRSPGPDRSKIVEQLGLHEYLCGSAHVRNLNNTCDL